MRRDYWSCTKFADWLRGTHKLKAGTAEEWNAWHKEAKGKRFRYWMAEEGLDFLQNFVYGPADLFNNIRHYFDNRWVSRTHALTSNLKRGQWHEFDTRLLHSFFDELVNFVEIEQALRYVSSAGEKCKRHTRSWYDKFLHIGRWRNPEAGLAYLTWISSLKYDEDWIDKDDPTFGCPTPQALAAQETIKLYKWWKDERPKRSDPIDASGWSDYCEKRRRETGTEDGLFWCNTNADGSNEAHKILETCHRIEKEQEDEDTDMLIRLIKIRTSLWT